MADLSTKLINLIRQMDEQCSEEGIDPHKALSIYQSHPEYANVHCSSNGETFNVMNDLDAVEKYLENLPHLIDDGK